MLKLVARCAFLIIKLVAWYHNKMQSYHADAQQKIGAQLQQQQDQLTATQAEVTTTSEIDKIDEANHDLPAGELSDKLR